MPRRTCLAIVLAAGEGRRMRSRTPKVLHQVAGRSLLAHVVNAASAAGTSNLAIVVGPDHGAVSADARKYAPKVQIFEQLERRGTAHAVLSARKAIARGADDILVIFGDTPLVRAETLSKLRGALSEGAAVAVLGFKPANPQGYGRLVMRGRELVAIREERDATPEERKIGLCNGGLMALAGKQALAILTRIGNANAKGEYDNTGYTLRGHLYTDASGRYQLETIVPGLYPGRTEHIHVKVQAPNGPVLTTQLFFPGVAGNQRDGIFDQKLLMTVQDAGDGKAATFNFVVDAGNSR